MSATLNPGQRTAVDAYVAAEAPFRAAMAAGRDLTPAEQADLFSATLDCKRLGVLGIAVEAAAERRNAR